MATLNDIISAYLTTESINATSKAVKISCQTVRRMLIQEGIYSTEKSREIARHAHQGKSIEEIASLLGLGKKCVQSYLPYTKGTYSVGDKTVNAKRIEKHRTKKKASATRVL